MLAASIASESFHFQVYLQRIAASLLCLCCLLGLSPNISPGHSGLQPSYCTKIPDSSRLVQAWHLEPLQQNDVIYINDLKYNLILATFIPTLRVQFNW